MPPILYPLSGRVYTDTRLMAQRTPSVRIKSVTKKNVGISVDTYFVRQSPTYCVVFFWYCVNNIAYALRFILRPVVF